MKNNKGDEKLIDIFAELLSLDLYPDTIEEAEAIILDTEIDHEEFVGKSTATYRNLLSEYKDDWRNTSEEVIDTEVAKLEAFILRSELSKRELIEKINSIADKLSASGQAKQLSLGLAHRNFDNQTKEDLAHLHRKLRYVASELDVDVDTRER